MYVADTIYDTPYYHLHTYDEPLHSHHKYSGRAGVLRAFHTDRPSIISIIG